ncbi:carboxymuconolactone decarboxylase family protein [Roseibium sp. CAU 1637]|uniref:Carboxymuconolactone decarboxylase family protein n=1 Tax=Roseibium limicola TaxID=2816037 RepID=A0A939JBG3_9HYPH|nr:carboxymuconolactone decarboxylase family protein [Roseibium limicola]MBO0347438.1 carboxymuconolactone decarboxylase family protein [Roseibium limicola]
MSRIPPLEPDALSSRQREVYEAIASGPRGRVRGPLAIWLNRPDLADRAQALGRYCRYDSSLSPRLSELAILATARVWMSEFEWAAHKPIALKAGISKEIVEAIRTGDDPVFLQADEEIVYRFSEMLHTQRKVTDEVYARAVEVLGQDAVVDLTGLLGYYTLISMTINVFEVPPPDGLKPELE